MRKNSFRNKYQLRIAVLRRKINIVEEAKREVQQQVDRLNQQYSRGEMGYREFAERVDVYLKKKPLDAWLRHYDETISIYKAHVQHCEQVMDARRFQMWKYFCISLVLVMIGRIVLLGS